MIKKIASDSIAQEMYSLLKRASKEEDDAKSHHSEDDAKSHHSEDDARSHHSEDESDDNSDMVEDNIEDYLMSDSEDDADESFVDDEIDLMAGYADDSEDDLMRRSNGSYEQSVDSAHDAGTDLLMATASDLHLMNGLGKIEASLRRKGEGFAADLVRATASSIKEDIVKEASKKNFVLKSLVKMASDLDKEGNVVAAEMVKNTIRKIN